MANWQSKLSNFIDSVWDSVNNRVHVDATLEVGDIEIGAVELKDAASDSRASVEAANTARTTATKVIAVQHVDAAGGVLAANPVLGAGTAAIGKLAANSGVDIGDVDVLTIGGQAPQWDDTDKFAVSLYGKGTAAGDTALLCNSARGLYVTDQGLTQAITDADYDLKNYPLQADGSSIVQQVRQQLYNNSTWDRARNNISVTVLASAARTATTNSADMTNYNGKAHLFFLNVSAITDTPSITLSLQYKDSISSNYFTIWTAATAVTATGQYAYMFGLGGSGSAGSFTEAVNLRLPRTWRLVATHADADSITYSVSCSELV
jgi:hypothetical protein